MTYFQIFFLYNYGIAYYYQKLILPSKMLTAIKISHIALVTDM